MGPGSPSKNGAPEKSKIWARKSPKIGGGLANQITEKMNSYDLLKKLQTDMVRYEVSWKSEYYYMYNSGYADLMLFLRNLSGDYNGTQY